MTGSFRAAQAVDTGQRGPDTLVSPAVHDLDYGAVTDRGVVRSINEDSILAVPPVFVVADGVGGSDAGEVASGIVIEEFERLTGPAVPAGTISPDQVRGALWAAHQRVLALSRQNTHGAGSTAVGAVAVVAGQEPYWVLFNLGDSRIYRLPPARPGETVSPVSQDPAGQSVDPGRLHQVTVDHSHVQELIEAGVISGDEAGRHPSRNLVTRAIGAKDGFDPDFWMFPVVPGDRLLICSDGLTAELIPETIGGIVAAGRPATETAGELLRLTLDAGARDNVSVIVVDVGAADGTPSSTRPGSETTDALPDGSAVGSAEPDQVAQ